jgi:capsular exopolysaccharide synthesis family protein
MLDGALDSTVSWEEFRRLRSHLYEFRSKQPLRRLLVSSALSGEGKTFVSANLGRVMAQRSSDSVLIVDGDLRLSRLYRPLGASASPGLSEYLQGDADIFSILQRGPVDNLFFVAGGASKCNAADLIGNGRLEVFLQRLAPAFDWVIIDSPPTLLVTDALLLGALCDAVLFVIRAGVTPVAMARRALHILRKRPLLGTVLNGSRLRMPYADYYGQYVPEPPKRGRRRK